MRIYFKKEFLKGMFASLLCLPFLLFTHEALAVSYTTVYLDNDEGAINSSQNHYEGNWTYQSYTGSYRGDHRLTSGTDGQRGSYVWKFGYKSGTRDFAVHLNHPNFTDPSAEYYVAENGTYGGAFLIRTFNQNTAPGGWNTIRAGYSSYSNYSHLVVSQSADAASTGADGARIIYAQ